MLIFNCCHEWSFIEYDALGRVVQSGITTKNIPKGEAALIALSDSISIVWSYYICCDTKSSKYCNYTKLLIMHNT